jgi:hypothetical protein
MMMWQPAQDISAAETPSQNDRCTCGGSGAAPGLSRPARRQPPRPLPSRASASQPQASADQAVGAAATPTPPPGRTAASHSQYSSESGKGARAGWSQGAAGCAVVDVDDAAARAKSAAAQRKWEKAAPRETNTRSSRRKAIWGSKRVCVARATGWRRGTASVPPASFLADRTIMPVFPTK